MSKKKMISAVLLIGTFVILFVTTFFLPDKIPFHFDVNGEAGWYASKYFVLLLTPVPYLIYHQFTHRKNEYSIMWKGDLFRWLLYSKLYLMIPDDRF